MSGNAPVKLGDTRSIYYSLADDVPDLTDEEKAKLEAVIQKAEEFEAEEAIRMSLFLQLDDRKKSRPRGALHLEGAIVTTNEEDTHSFTVSALCGEVYKLKACDAKERQIWVDKIQTTIENEKYLKGSEAQVPADDLLMSTSPKAFNFCKSSTFHIPRPEGGDSQDRTSPGSSCDKVPADPILEIKESVCKSVECQKVLAKYIESLPLSDSNIKCSDCRLLLIKAISQASVQSLEQCYLILRRRRQYEVMKSVKANIRASTDSLDKMKPQPMKKEGKRVELAKNM
ncbi:oxysterol-binding protein-related protein 11-like [Uloborus diversus]|uniref:oxysterol-binding protein-related protein 11-like n=1 Tax=Uloborus diversus TaxID=327109 RepID=UPI002409871A|nr:oxysterol-binding protein-related protein 11-like [Uloborus diversus]